MYGKDILGDIASHAEAGAVSIGYKSNAITFLSCLLYYCRTCILSNGLNYIKGNTDIFLNSVII